MIDDNVSDDLEWFSEYYFPINDDNFLYTGEHGMLRGCVGRIGLASLKADVTHSLFWIFSPNSGRYSDMNFKVFANNLEKLDKEDVSNMTIRVDLRRFSD
jgi:hypothetical protein